MSSGDRLRRMALELAALAQTGSAFAKDQYDEKRYARLTELAADLMAELTDVDAAVVRSHLDVDGGYATPHLDVRGALFRGGRVLLVQEASDGRWTLPGGWADVLDTPRLAIEREFAEEAGLSVRTTRLVMVHDGTVHNGHLQRGPAFHIWKLFFLCEPLDGAAPQAGLDGETTDVDYFALDELPELSTGRTTADQLHRLAAHAADPTLPPDVD